MQHYTLPMTFTRPSSSVRLAALALGALLAFTLSGAAHAQWKWKDKTGRVQYSDMPPPPSVGEADILQRPSAAAARNAGPAFAPAGTAQAAAAAMAASAAASAPAGPASGALEPELEAKRRQAADAEAAKRKAEEDKNKAVKADNCQRAQAQLRALDNGMRMARVNAKGEREILDDKARADEAKRARQIAASECK